MLGLHLGEEEERGGDYFGPVVNTAALVEAAGHGGQVLLTDAERQATEVAAIDLGAYPLNGVPEPVRIWQVGQGEFPPLRIAGSGSNLPMPQTRLLGRDEDVRVVLALLGDWLGETPAVRGLCIVSQRSA